LVTGGTGLIGSAVVLRSLRADDGNHWTLLVRANNETHARARLVARWERSVGLDEAIAFADRCEIVCGDLVDIESNGDKRLDDVTHVLHLAADTSFRSRESNWRINHDGTLALAARVSRNVGLRRFLHVGTAMICGRDGAGRLVDEAAFPHPDAQHIAEYTRSKSVTELALAERFPDLPVIVARPSIVVGDTILGCEPTSSIFWSTRLGDRLGLVSCGMDGSIDIVPFDWTAEALLFLLDKPELRHRRYHLSAGRERRSSWTDIAAAFGKAEGRAPHQYESFEVGHGPLLRERFFRHFDRKDPLAVTMCIAQKKYYEFCALDVTFDNTRLIDEGFHLPPRFADYIGVCMSRPGDASILDMFRDDLFLFEPVDPVTAPVAA
jgi:nucleoside-diphosphate-sugar epimerase